MTKQQTGGGEIYQPVDKAVIAFIAIVCLGYLLWTAATVYNLAINGAWTALSTVWLAVTLSILVALYLQYRVDKQDRARHASN